MERNVSLLITLLSFLFFTASLLSRVMSIPLDCLSPLEICAIATNSGVEILPKDILEKDLFGDSLASEPPRMIQVRKDGAEVTVHLPCVGHPRNTLLESQLSWSSYTGPNGLERAYALQCCLSVAINIARYANADFAKNKERLKKEWNEMIASLGPKRKNLETQTLVTDSQPASSISPDPSKRAK